MIVAYRRSLRRFPASGPRLAETVVHMSLRAVGILAVILTGACGRTRLAQGGRRGTRAQPAISRATAGAAPWAMAGIQVVRAARLVPVQLPATRARLRKAAPPALVAPPAASADLSAGARLFAAAPLAAASLPARVLDLPQGARPVRAGLLAPLEPWAGSRPQGRAPRSPASLRRRRQ